MANLECSFLDQEKRIKNPFIIEISSDIEPEEFPQAAYCGAILLSAFLPELEKMTAQESIEESISEKFQFPYSQKYLNYIEKWKKSSDSLIIANLDVDYKTDIQTLCSSMENAGADAIWLRLFLFPDDKDFRSLDYEKIFLETAAQITYSAKIPIIITLPVFFTNIFNIIEQLYYRGIQGYCLSPKLQYFDYNIDDFENIQNQNLDESSLFLIQLKWIALLSAYFPKIDLIARIDTLNNIEESIKYILAGANAILLAHNADVSESSLTDALNSMETWMESQGFEKIEHFHAQLNSQKLHSPSHEERKSHLADPFNNFFPL
jgi:dihydroorotate dehydrogenase